MVYTPATKHPNGARLLALDGGGVRGIMSLMVLQEVMFRVQRKKGLKEEPLPIDYFELAAGTSTGGIIGIMLFRLRMTATQAIEQYNLIAERVFSPTLAGYNIGWMHKSISSFFNATKTVLRTTRFDDANLKKAIDQVVEVFGLDENDRKLKGNAPLQHPKAGRVFCCTTAQNRAENVLLRTYKDNNIYPSSVVNRVMSTHQESVTISLAARATSAAPTYFVEVPFPENSKKGDRDRLVFWDGGLLNNNPIDQLWYSRYELTPKDTAAPAVSCVISLGTGYVRPDAPLESWLQVAGIAGEVMEFATNTNAKGKDFSRHVQTIKDRPEHKDMKYIRLNPSLKKNVIGLADYTMMPELKALTREYLDDKGNQEWIDLAVEAICA